jgi:hypothetical protein
MLTRFLLSLLPETLALAALGLLLLALGPGVPLADDWSMSSMLQGDVVGSAMHSHHIDPSMISADLVSPWLSSRDWAMYRPLSTAALQGGISALGLWSPYAHLLNFALLASSVLVLGALLRHLRLCVWRRSLVLLGLVLHPALIEPLVWFSSASGMLSMLLVLVTLGLSLVATRRPWAPAAGLMALAACLAKEDGTLALLAVFLVAASQGPRAPRARALAIWALVAALLYALMRWYALGSLLPAYDISGQAAPLRMMAESAAEKLTWIFAPAAAHGPTWLLLGAGPVILVFLVALITPLRIAIGLVLVPAAAALLSLNHGIQSDGSGTRVLLPMLYGGLALLVAATSSVSRSTRTGLVVFALLFVAALPLTVQRVLTFREARHVSHELQTQFASILRSNRDGTPLATTTFAQSHEGYPLFLENLVFPLALERAPGSANPVIGLQAVLHWIYVSRNVLGDATPLRIAAELGARELTYQATPEPSLQVAERPIPPPPRITRPRSSGLPKAEFSCRPPWIHA